MNEFVTYVLYSPSSGKTYTGYTSDLINRMKSHNHYGKKGFTLRFRPWIVVYVKFFDSQQEAMRYEVELKTGKGRDFIKDQILVRV
jgi:putative endonuclease